MAIFDTIAMAIVDALDALIPSRFADGAPGDDQRDATTESMAIIAEEILTGSRSGRTIERYQSTGIVVGSSAVELPFQTLRRNDDTDLFTAVSVTQTQIEEPGTYTLDYAAAFTGGTGSVNVRMEIRSDGTPIPGAVAYATWDGAADQSGTSARCTLDVVDGDRITVAAVRIGAGGGTVTTIPDGTSISIRRITP